MSLDGVTKSMLQECIVGQLAGWINSERHPDVAVNASGLHARHEMRLRVSDSNNTDWVICISRVVAGEAQTDIS